MSRDAAWYGIGGGAVRPSAPRADHILPNLIVFVFVQIAGAVATFIAWWAILFTGRYPHGLFRFNTGVLRWSQRGCMNRLRNRAR